MKFKNSLSHIQYQQFIKKSILELFKKGIIKSITSYAALIVKMYITDLTQIRQIMKPYYSDKPRGEIPRDPTNMMRSLILMKFTGEHSITKWIKTINNQDIYAILSGFEPNDVPGVGTFYDFMKRLSLIDQNEFRERQHKLRNFKRKPKKNLSKNQKQGPKHPNIVNLLVQRVLKYKAHPVHLGPDKLIHILFRQCFVLHSAEKGLLGDINNMTISGDGTLVHTAASPYGIKVCDCKSKGIYNCNCKRIFSDFNARWGWDSFREMYVYGYNFFEIVASDSLYDLPIFFLRTQAPRHDGVSSVIAIDKALKLYPQFNFTQFLGDSAMDNYGFYKLLNHFQIEPFITLNETKSGQFIYQQLQINKHGIPICAGGLEMIYNGYCPDRMRHKWRCPLKSSKSFPVDKEHICKSLNYCTPSDYGRTFYTYNKDNFRLFTKIPRKSQQWKHTFKRRTSSERSNKRKKNDYQLEQDRARSYYQWMIRYALTAMCQHIDAWYCQSGTNIRNMCKDWEKP